jgi:hypothetical protein
MSTFTWLDYSECARPAMFDVVDLFREQDTRDELRLGTVYAAIEGGVAECASTCPVGD